ncbi:ubiquitin-protein transferase [Aureococcus anophagefferens]|nr:ubiquitin-protein transferase [Aureococcus anophagefferens]
MGANESSLEGDAMAQEADDSSSSLSATGAASAYDAPPEPPEAEAPAEAATSPGDEPPELLCPITLSMMGDPVVANDGHSYERAAIATWLATHDASRGRADGRREPVPNHALRAQIGEWRAARACRPCPSAAGPSTPRAPAARRYATAARAARRRARDAATPYADRRDYVERFSPLHRVVGCARPPDFDPAPLVPDRSRARTGASRRGLAPAHVAAERGKARALAALLRAGADPALPQRGGCHETCVHLAVRHKRLGALRALLDVVGRAPAVVDARTTDGSTPLHLAAAVGSREATEALLDASAGGGAGARRRLRRCVAAWTNALPSRRRSSRAARGRRRQARRVDAAPPLREPGLTAC